nr:radial spoke head 10-like protein B2-like; partial [Biomphalaria glabrata]
MASKDRRKSDRKLNKKSDEVSVDKTEEILTVISESIESQVSEATVSVVESEKISKEVTPEPVYDEPTLSELIIESCTCEKVKGLYQGEGEARFKDGHTYKGQFMDGLMHGQGAYCWTDGVTYQGDFYENQITGKGAYTWPDGSTYSGDVLKGIRHGFGTFICSKGRVSYSGDWNMGQKHGKGRIDFDPEGKSFYDGDWVNGIKHGWGTRQYPSGNIYIGMWFNNVRHGDGTMKWLDRDQIYNGQWENGIQHGFGQHIWILKRKLHSQYSLRNMYDGEFVNGLRHGQGIFYYANGARYEGSWKDNMKHGKGKFTFKNGRIYEGMFEKDHIVEYPDFTIDGLISPDLSQIRTRTPVPADNVSVHSNESRNTTGPSFQLDIPELLASLPTEESDYEASQVQFAITRHISALRRIYTFYSMLGYDESPDNTFIMNKMQFWRFLKDIHLHHDKYTLTDMDRIIGENYQKQKFELHNPYEKVLHRQFINYLIIIAHMVYKKEYFKNKEKAPILEHCFSRLMTERILRHSCMVKGPLFQETRRAINALVHMDQSYQIYRVICTPRKKPPKEPVIKMRAFMFFMKEIGLINQDLTPTRLVELLASDNPLVMDGQGCYNLELEMTFLEFFEALLLCAEVFVTERVVKDPTTPRISLRSIQKEASQHSLVISMSHKISQPGVEEEVLIDVLDNTTYPEDQTSSEHTPVNPNHSSSSQSIQKIESEFPLDSVSNTNQSALGYLTPSQSKDATRKSPAVSATSESVAIEKQITSPALNQDGQIMVAENGTRDLSPDAAEVESEVLDEDTRQFNFWTHQLHIFFLRKFFPKAQKYVESKKQGQGCRKTTALKDSTARPNTEPIAVGSAQEAAEEENTTA